MNGNTALDKITSVEDLTTKWLSEVLSYPVTSFTSKQIGTGQVSTCYRLNLSYDDTAAATAAAVAPPPTVILKVASTNPQSRQSGVSLNLYAREVKIYQDIAPSIQDAVPKCYHASFHPETATFTLLLSDAGAAAPGDDIKGASLEQARAAISTLGRMHGTMLRDPKFAEKAKAFERAAPLSQAVLAALFAGFEQRYKSRMKEEHLEVCRRYVESFDAFQKSQEAKFSGPKGIVHGDYRLDNLLFGERDMLVVDWQTVFVGPMLADLAYFLGCSIKIEDRRRHIEEFLDVYLEGVGSGTEITRDIVKEGLREQVFLGVVMGIASPMMVQQTERGDEMFMTMLERHCTAVLDLKSLDLLPQKTVLAPLLPDPKDEHPHVQGSEQYWNESWYFDFVDEKSGVGVYVRLGLYPNLEGSWYTAVITHPTKRLISFTDYKCPHPGPDLTIKTDRFSASQKVVDELKTYHLTLKGLGEQYDDPAAVLRSESGKDVNVDLDLTWHTDGTPYAWRMTTRYEIPCRVSGTITIDGDEAIQLTDAKAQRDHSHGVRDWWSFNWMWCAFHLHDGTHIHGSDLRLPTIGRTSVGYIQGPNLAIAELTKCHSEEVMGADGLPSASSVVLEYVGGSAPLVVEIVPVGHGPLRLVSGEGKVSNFTRCWVEVRVSDGRTGVGWIEWNHVQGEGGGG